MRFFSVFWSTCILAIGFNLSSAWAQGTTMTCHFLTGPRAGQTQSYWGVPGVSPVAIGSPCADLLGSFGIGVADGTSGGLPAGMTLTCQFTSGPRAGQAQNYAGVSGVDPIPVGAPCSDLQGSSGYGR